MAHGHKSIHDTDAVLSTEANQNEAIMGFDFYANAQYPLIMKQQTISDSIIKDLSLPLICNISV